MTQTGEVTTLSAAVDAFVSARKNGAELRQALARFLRWFGDDRPVSALTPADLEAYSQDASAETLGGAERIKAVREFLQHARKAGIIEQQLSAHVKVHRTGRNARPRPRPAGREAEVVPLTPEGHAELLKQVEFLKDELARNAKEIARAAADKDVRENAPLEAAREYQGQLTSRLMATEDTLARARVLDPSEADGQEVRHGSTFQLEAIGSGQVQEWTIVDPREADLKARKISTSSPVGEAVLGKRIGDEIEVTAPKGAMRYRLIRIE